MYISPLLSRMKPTTGLVTFSVSNEPPAPTVIKATEPSITTYQPSMRWKPASASGVMNMMTTDFACAPSWKPTEPEIVL